ncbi:hypothetical protein F4859DRAFT_510631 [Xylaria cf. heliscus]|nr:hypothetical protein F4859DRAFT_510631 [Xylaria cf. heliscus]
MSSNPIFKGCVVSIAGDLEDYEWREEKVKQWVHYWGGTFSSKVDGEVTHLLCTKENFKKKIHDVRVALKDESIKVVMRDWLEDSINKKMRLKTLPYQLDEEARKEEAKRRKIQKMEQYSKNAHNYVDERFWHPYRDSTNFQYQVELKRNDEESGNVGEKHQLTLWESNAKPYNYRCTTMFTKRSKNKGSPLEFHESPVDLETGFREFKKFFWKKTRVLWDDRIEKMGTTGLEHFQYQPPSGGKPVGLVKGRHASIFGGDGFVGASNQADKEERHDDSLVGDVGAVGSHCKRVREGDIADDAGMNIEDVERPAKRSKFETAGAVRMPVESEADPGGEASDADSGYSSISIPEPEEEFQGVQVRGETPSSEPLQDFDDVNEAQSDAPEFDDVINDGTLEPADYYYNEHQSEHDSAGEYNTPESITSNDDGVAAPYNSEEEHDDEEAGNSEVNDDDGAEIVVEDAEVDCIPRENNEQEAHDISKMYDEVQYAEIEIEDEEEDDNDDGDDDDDISLEAVRARRLAREISAAAANIYDEMRRGVALVQDSQAQLIDGVRAREAYICSRAKKRKEREEMEDAEDAEDEDEEEDAEEEGDAEEDAKVQEEEEEEEDAEEENNAKEDAEVVEEEGEAVDFGSDGSKDY